MNLIEFLDKDKEKHQEAVENTPFFRPSELDNLIEEAKRFLKDNKEFAKDLYAYAECYETVKDSWYGFRAAYNLVKHIVDAYESEDC